MRGSVLEADLEGDSIHGAYFVVIDGKVKK
jgi:hypothetical protein